VRRPRQTAPAPRVARETTDLRIDSLAAGGDGVGRAPDGRAVFVPGTAPGDRVRVRLVEVRARHARGRAVELLEAGPARTDPVCAVFGACGGCTWQHVAYPAQLEAKAAILRDALERIGRLEVPGELRVEPSPSPYAYRGRARVLVEGGRVGFRRLRSHALCATTRCPVLVPELEARLRELGEHPPEQAGEWELTAGEGGATRAVPLEGSGKRGEPILVAVGEDRLRVSPGVFVQSNALLLETLAGAVAEAAGRGALALELFAGAGFLTLGLAKRFSRVVAVEASHAAAADLAESCRAAGLANVEVVAEPVEAVLAMRRLPAGADAAVLDPPRRGLPPGSAEALARLAPRRIAMLSCDPATLARDAALLDAEGFTLCGVRGFDLFPQTAHVEALAVLER
jgi:23S rRNA (uracil1939-C5)-methyltransferase